VERCFNVEITQILLFGEKKDLIIYDNTVLEKIRNLIDDILLAVACIKHVWTGQVSEEKLL
jgi:hypothetical protein